MRMGVKDIVSSFETLNERDKRKVLIGIGVMKPQGRHSTGRFGTAVHSRSGSKDSTNIDFAPVPGRRCPTCGK